jgi:nucleoside-diphosphate-sugar epimerase
VDRVRSGALALGPGDGAWMNFCHLEDAVALVLAALDRGRVGAVYHGSDAEPIRQRDLVAFVAGRLGMAPPRHAGAVALPGRAPGANRRIRGERTRAELSLRLLWPSVRDGLGPFLPPGEAP